MVLGSVALVPYHFEAVNSFLEDKTFDDVVAAHAVDLILEKAAPPNTTVNQIRSCARRGDVTLTEAGEDDRRVGLFRGMGILLKAGLDLPVRSRDAQQLAKLDW